MSELDGYADPEVYMDELEEACDYGLEFCSDPHLKHMNCCFECKDYIHLCEEQEKHRKEEAEKAMWSAKDPKLAELLEGGQTE